MSSTRWTSKPLAGWAAAESATTPTFFIRNLEGTSADFRFDPLHLDSTWTIITDAIHRLRRRDGATSSNVEGESLPGDR
jgi:hypothetical protein